MDLFSTHTRIHLQLGFKIYHAPGRRSLYTKVVDFMPRYVLVNNLKDLPVRLIQTDELGRTSSDYDIMTVPQLNASAFHLPRVRGVHRVRLKPLGKWKMTSPIPVDNPGEYFSMIQRSTYEVPTIPGTRAGRADGTFKVEGIKLDGQNPYGLFFETQWGSSEQVLIKRIKANSAAAATQKFKVGHGRPQKPAR